MVTVGLFTNQKSGKNLLDRRRLHILKKTVGDQGKVYVTGKSKDYLSELEDRVIQFYKDKPDVVVVDGGDSSVCAVLTALDNYGQGNFLPTGIIEGGTFNNLSKEIGSNRPKYLKNILETPKINDLTLTDIHMMNVNDGKYDYLSFSSGVGLPVIFLEELYKNKRLKYFQFGLIALRTIGSLLVNGEYYNRLNKKQRLTVTAEGHAGKIVKDGYWLGIMAQSISSLGLPKQFPQPRIFNKAGIEGKFHTLGTTLSLSRLLGYSIPLWKGDTVHYTNWETGETRQVMDFNNQVKQITIESNDSFRYFVNGDLDWDYKPCLTKKLTMGPGKKINFIKK